MKIPTSYTFLVQLELHATRLSIILIASISTIGVYSQTAVIMPAIPYEQYRALKISSQNQNKELPDPEYWGLAGVEWETKQTAITKTENVASQIELGLPCSREMRFASPSGGLSTIRYHFASGITNRGERFNLYQILKSNLVKVYQAPTHNIKPDEVFRGRDAYVQGVADEYALEWHGLETIVRLCLSDQDLVLEFRQAPTSQALIKKEKVAKGSEFQANAKPMTVQNFNASTTNSP